MYVYLKMDGRLDDHQSIGVGRFECSMRLDIPKEEFEKKLMKKKAIIINDNILKINKLEKILYSDESFSKETSYILPIGASVKKKTFFQKLKTLYFG